MQEELGALQVRFETVRQSNQAHYRELEKLQRQFVGKFPQSRIPLLTLDEYDIKSFELDGTPKYIEVKSTTSKPPAQNGGVCFYISAGEFEQAQKLPNYYFFIVFDVKSANPKIWRIRDPAKLKPGLLLLQPSAYYATMTAAAPKETDEHE